MQTTLCYIERDGKYLMLHRVKKQNDINRDKWLGIGGKFLDGETPFDCVLREVKEETGLTLNDYKYRGVVEFVSDMFECEVMHLFSSSSFTGNILTTCDEGVLEWIDKDRLYDLTMWEGDKVFLKLLETEPRFFRVKLVYKGERLVSSEVKFD